MSSTVPLVFPSHHHPKGRAYISEGNVSDIADKKNSCQWNPAWCFMKQTDIDFYTRHYKLIYVDTELRKSVLKSSAKIFKVLCLAARYK